MDRNFLIALRGYDMTDVDRVLDQADQALASGDVVARAAAREALAGARFRSRMRGYARKQVDRVVEERLGRLQQDAGS